MAEPSVWMPIYIGDYLSDTQHLCAEEHGAYLLLIMAYWKHGGALKSDKKALHNITKVPYRKLTKVLALFERRDGLLYHKRIEKELKHAAALKEKNKERTQKATEAKIKNSKSVTSTVTSTVTFTPSPSPSPSHIIISNDGLDLNNFMHLHDVMCCMLGVKHLSKSDQETLAGWTERYDMRHFALPHIEHSLNNFRARNQGQNPASLSYFTTVLEHTASPEVGGVVRNLTQNWKE